MSLNSNITNKKIKIIAQNMITNFFFSQPEAFAGIKSNTKFASAIQKSFANQTLTLAKTVEEDVEPVTYFCTSCNMSQVGEMGNNICSHCGGSIKRGMDIYF